MALWEAVQITSELASEQVERCMALTPIDLLLEQVESLKRQRGEQEAYIQDQEESSSDALVQALKQLRELDKFIRIIENKIRERQEGFSTQGKEKRTPMRMLRAEYRGMKLGDIVAKVLSENQGLLTTTELTCLIYKTENDDELDRARNSLSSELRSGIKVQNPRWRKVGRNAYTAIDHLRR